MHSELAGELQSRLAVHSDDDSQSNDANAENDGSSTTEEHGEFLYDIVFHLMAQLNVIFYFLFIESTEQMLAAYMCEVQNFTPETVDKETNTECAFLPEKQRNRLGAGMVGTTGADRLSMSSSSGDIIDERVVKRSQTFSPSVASKNRYICRLNRSDSDSAMHFGGPSLQHSFNRGAVERRSLRLNSKIPKTVPSSE